MSVYSSNIISDYSYLISQLQQCKCECQRRVIVHLVFGSPSHPYPINIMRNIALESGFGSTVDYVGVYDIDFVPSPGLCSKISYWTRNLQNVEIPLYSPYPRSNALSNVSLSVESSLPTSNAGGLSSSSSSSTNIANSLQLLPSARLMLVAPAFEFKVKDENLEVTWPQSKSHLSDLIDSEDILRFHSDFEGQELNFTHWKDTAHPFVHSPIRLLNEHYAWYSRSLFSQITSDPLCDEVFFDRGYNKIMCYIHLRLLSFAPVILPDSWVLHAPESEESITITEQVSHNYEEQVNELHAITSQQGEETKGLSQNSESSLRPHRRPTPAYYKRLFHYQICSQLSRYGWIDASNVCIRYCEIQALKESLSFYKSRSYLRLCYNDIVNLQGLTGEYDSERLQMELMLLEAWIARAGKSLSFLSNGDGTFKDGPYALDSFVEDENPNYRRRRRRRRRYH